MPRGFLWFAAIVVVLSIAVALVRPDPGVTPFLLVLIPPVAATIAAAASGGRRAIGTLIGRITLFRAPGRFYAAAIGVPVLLTAAIDVVGVVAGQSDLGHLASSITVAAFLVPLVVALPAFFEEYGWRGYALPALVEARVPPLAAAVAVFVLFTIPHLVLHLPGEQYADLPVWPTPLTLLGYSMFLAWLFLRSGGSSFLTAIAHATLNGLVPLTRGLDPVWVWQARGALSVILAIVFGLLLTVSPRR